jgi:L-asparaginase
MQNNASTVVILGTGGTIAGTAASAADNVGYTAAQLGVASLVAAVPALAGQAIEAEQVAQLDSKDMDFATWQRLAQRVAFHLARADVAGIVITHGTDTLEETAWFLQRVLAPAKPVVLTAAMRPATSLQTDGPQNLLDAVAVARHPQARGVVAVLAGAVHAAAHVRKARNYRVDAFGSGDAGPVAWVEEGRLRVVGAWPAGDGLGLAVVAAPVATWPRVEIVINHAGADGAIVDALVALGARGIVAAGTGNGTLHHALEAALRAAQAQGVCVLRATRCAEGAVVGEPAGALPSAGALSPVKARVELLLTLLAAP